MFCWEVVEVIEEIGEDVKVLASFVNGKLQPVIFKWRNRTYQPLTIASSWSDYEGQFKRVYFSVLTDQSNLYELCFHTRNFQWCLVRIHHD